MVVLGLRASVSETDRYNLTTMLIRIGYDITLRFPFPTTVIHLLHVHPSRRSDLIRPDRMWTEPALITDKYSDSFGNYRRRISVPAGVVRFASEAVIQDSGDRDPHVPDAAQLDVCKLPTATIQFLLPSRYCEVDSELMDFAWLNFCKTQPGWARVQAICDFVHGHLQFDYRQARSDRTALGAFRERVGVCRDFAHLAITLCRCLNIPARYATGYLGDICVPPAPDPMDFSAWFEVYLEGGWYTFDARHNCRRVGRVLIGLGNDAGDVPITMSFGKSLLETFHVFTEQIDSSAFGEHIVKAA